MVVGVALVCCLLAQDPSTEGTGEIERVTLLADDAAFARDRAVDDAAERGLAWLAAAQNERGYWQAHVGHKQMDDYRILRSAQLNESLGEGHPGVTALAGMAFLAGGHLPGRGQYGTVVERTVEYLLEHIQENGIITDGGSRMYSHAFATLFLAEVAGMSPDRRVEAGLERAVHIIVDCQNRYGAWRYNAFTTQADLSVTVCQLQALRAARNIGIKVPAGTIDAAVDYVKASRTPRGADKGLFFYKIHGRAAWTKNTQYAINAAGITALFSAGVHDEALYGPALDFLDEQYGDIRDWYHTHYFFWYGNYYACQAFFQAGGVRAKSYQQRITKDLLRMQQADGRWVNRTGPGDAFSTGIACLILQIPKQYLPIFQR